MSVFKALKSAYNVSADSWMLQYPGRRITHYDVANIFARAYNRIANIEKATNGFRHTGLWPFDSQVFPDDEFTAADLLMDRDAGEQEDVPPAAARREEDWADDANDLAGDADLAGAGDAQAGAARRVPSSSDAASRCVVAGKATSTSACDQPGSYRFIHTYLERYQFCHILVGKAALMIMSLFPFLCFS